MLKNRLPGLAVLISLTPSWEVQSVITGSPYPPQVWSGFWVTSPSEYFSHLYHCAQVPGNSEQPNVSHIVMIIISSVTINQIPSACLHVEVSHQEMGMDLLQVVSDKELKMETLSSTKFCRSKHWTHAAAERVTIFGFPNTVATSWSEVNVKLSKDLIHLQMEISLDDSMKMHLSCSPANMLRESWVKLSVNAKNWCYLC